MRVRTLAAAIGVPLGAAAIAVACYFLIPLVKPLFSKAPLFDDQLAAVDASLAGGYLSTARAQLEAISAIPRMASDRMRLLKRAYIASRQLGDYQLLTDVSRRVLASDRGSRESRLLVGYAFLRSGRVADARKDLEGPLPDGIGDLLRGEAALRAGAAWKGSDEITREVLALEGSRAPGDFEAAAQRTGDRRLALDAAILSMETGNVVRAGLIARSALRDAPFDEPAAVIAYDSGDFEEAIRRLLRFQAGRVMRADISLVLADSFEALGRTDDAERALEQALRIDPRVSWTPYASLGAFAEARGGHDEARRLLQQGHGLFPGSSELVMESAQLEAGQGNVPAAISLLDRLLESRPEDSAAALFRLHLRAPQLSPEAYRAELWRIFTRTPADQAAFMTLVTSLVATHDWDGAMLALRQHDEASGGSSSDTQLVFGVVEAMEGSWGASLAALRGAADAAKDGASRYDLAVVLMKQGKAADAIAELTAAGSEALSQASGDARTRLLARIAVLSGTALRASGDLAGARAAFLHARELDPHDLRAALELRKLEAGGDQ